MDPTDSTPTPRAAVSKPGPLGWVYLALFVAFIVAGVVAKRFFGRAEFVPAFHLPAAVFLVLSGYELTQKAREEYRRQYERWQLTQNEKKTVAPPRL